MNVHETWYIYLNKCGNYFQGHPKVIRGHLRSNYHTVMNVHETWYVCSDRPNRRDSWFEIRLVDITGQTSLNMLKTLSVLNFRIKG